MSRYYDFREGELTCRHCGWTGTGKEMNLGDTFADGAEYDCPNCGEKYGFVMWPRTKDMVDDPRAPEIDQLHGKVVLQKQDDDD